MMREEIIVKEVLRYLNVPYITADQSLKEQILEAYKDLTSVATLRTAYQLFEFDMNKNFISLKEVLFHVASDDLARLLKNCKKVYLMATTIGGEVDRKISVAQQTDMMKALIYNGCANVMIEEACDNIESEIMKELEPNEFLTMRYSPGYGDVALKVQAEILNVLEAAKRAGITTTKAGMLIPLKSITAFIGVSSVKEERQKTCDKCLIQERCIYRKRGERCGD